MPAKCRVTLVHVDFPTYSFVRPPFVQLAVFAGDQRHRRVEIFQGERRKIRIMGVLVELPREDEIEYSTLRGQLQGGKSQRTATNTNFPFTRYSQGVAKAR